jgi:tripartite-type tricarboxylate transporter receptor subunit TctC
MRKFFPLIVASACFLSGMPAAYAQGPQEAKAHYPDKPIRIVVAYAAGQGTDTVTRYITELMGKDLGQSFVVDNRAGAGGNLGTEAAARAPADGYTLTMGTIATHVLNQFLYSKIPFDAEKDFEPIGLVGTFPMIVAVNNDVPFASVADLLAATKRKSGTADIAMPSTTARLVVELLKEKTGVPLFGVPYKGSGSAMTDVIGAQLPAIVDTPTALRSHIASGKVKAIGVTSVKPSGLVPGVKPVAEQGIDGFEVIAWNALYAPKGTPPAVIATLNAALNKVLARPEVHQRLLDLGFEPAGGSPAKLAEFARAERSKWGPLIQAAGIRVD